MLGFRANAHQISAIDDSLAAHKGDNNSSVVTILDLFRYIYGKIKAEVAIKKKEIIATEGQMAPVSRELTAADSEADAVATAAPTVSPPRLVLNQTPLIFVPPGRADLLANRVCYRCGPPPAPEKPFVSNGTALLDVYAVQLVFSNYFVEYPQWY